MAMLFGKSVGETGKFNIYEKDYLEQDGEIKRIKPKSVMFGSNYSTDGATKSYRALMPDVDFNNPKPVPFLEDLVCYASDPDEESIMMDFFSGSGTLGHAVMSRNASDNGKRRFVLVQLPEEIDHPTYKVISSITKERLRRAGAKVKSDNPTFAGDTGFRVFKLDTSNIQAWNPDRNNLEKTLLDHEEHILSGRTESDIVYELLLKLGLDLCVPIESCIIAGKTVNAIGGGVLLACLAERIAVAEVEALAQGIISWHKELAPAGDTTCVFRDSAFENDIAKSNLAAILEQYGIRNVRSL